MRAVLLCVLVCLACGRQTPNFSGRVVDALAGSPIAGARISAVGAPEVETDSDGRFELPLPPSAVNVDAAGYLSKRAVSAGEISLTPEEVSDEVGEALHAKLHSRPRLPEGDVRPEFESLMAGEELEVFVGDQSVTPGVVAPWGQLRQGLSAEPQTIRVWRRRVDGSETSCTGRVDVIDFEDYIKGVLPNEWLASWDRRALRMGAVAIRSYAWAIIASGGRYQCADVDDSSNTEVYDDDRVAKTNQIVDETRGQVIVRNGKLVSGQYSAENGDPTAFGVSEPYCAGKPIAGHRRGTCQRGTQRWATLEGRDHAWMAAHYYPDAGLYVPGVLGLGVAPVDADAGSLPPDQVELEESAQPVPALEPDLGPSADDAAPGCSTSAAFPFTMGLLLMVGLRRRRR